MKAKTIEKGIEKKKTGIDFAYEGDFVETLKDFLGRIMPQKKDYRELLKIDLDEYVFENIDIILVSSIPDRITGKDFSKYGLQKLRKIKGIMPIEIEETQESKKKKLVLSYQSTSIGVINEKLLRS